MISKECFSPQWIDEISAKLEYKDKSLIEKVIRALSLLEMLVQSGCPLTFKGCTALMLILGQSLHRLSIDIDIPLQSPDWTPHQGRLRSGGNVGAQPT